MSQEDGYLGPGTMSQLPEELKLLFSSQDIVKMYGVCMKSWSNCLQAVWNQIPKEIPAPMKFLTCLFPKDSGVDLTR